MKKTILILIACVAMGCERSNEYDKKFDYYNGQHSGLQIAFDTVHNSTININDKLGLELEILAGQCRAFDSMCKYGKLSLNH